MGHSNQESSDSSAPGASSLSGIGCPSQGSIFPFRDWSSLVGPDRPFWGTIFNFKFNRPFLGLVQNFPHHFKILMLFGLFSIFYRHSSAYLYLCLLVTRARMKINNECIFLLRNYIVQPESRERIENSVAAMDLHEGWQCIQLPSYGSEETNNQS